MKKFLIFPERERCLFWHIEVTGDSLALTRGDEGTLGYTVHVNFPDEDRCLFEARKLMDKQLKAGYVECDEGFIRRFDVTPAMKKALAKDRQVHTRNGRVTLSILPSVKLIGVVMDPRRQGVLDGNPYHDQEGVFCTTGYSLVAKCPEKYNAENLLIWLPVPELFGTWDAEEKQFYVFPDTTWEDIEADLSGYLVRAMKRKGLTPITTYRKVWEFCDFIPDVLEDRANAIGERPSNDLRTGKIEAFLGRYEQRLLRHPVSRALEGAYYAIANLCYSTGMHYMRKGDYREAVHWLERSLLVINQWPRFRQDLFNEVYMHLALCYFHVQDFHRAQQYTRVYRAFNPEAGEACFDIIKSIEKVKILHLTAMVAYRKALEIRTDNCYEEAIRLTHIALEVSPEDPVLHYNLACFYSLSHKTKESLYYLEEALKKGFKSRSEILTERDLEHVRATREFENIRLKYF